MFVDDFDYGDDEDDAQRIAAQQRRRVHEERRAAEQSSNGVSASGGGVGMLSQLLSAAEDHGDAALPVLSQLMGRDVRVASVGDQVWLAGCGKMGASGVAC